VITESHKVTPFALLSTKAQDQEDALCFKVCHLIFQVYFRV